MPKKLTELKKSAVKSNKKILKPVSGSSPKLVSSESEKSFVRRPQPKKIRKVEVEKILVENFATLQKVMVNLSVKLDSLTEQISQLLNLFEISAKALVERGADLGDNYEKKMMEKIDNLVDQNKTIARGVTLLHEEKPAERSAQGVQPQERLGGEVSQQSPEAGENIEGYQKSISARNQQPRVVRR